MVGQLKGPSPKTCSLKCKISQEASCYSEANNKNDYYKLIQSSTSVFNNSLLIYRLCNHIRSANRQQDKPGLRIKDHNDTRYIHQFKQLRISRVSPALLYNCTFGGITSKRLNSNIKLGSIYYRTICKSGILISHRLLLPV